MLDLQDVRKSYGKFHAVQGVSFSVKKGEIVGLLGPNGAGKTTLMRILTGYHFPGSGSVNVDGLDLYSSQREIKNKIGYLPENAPLYPELSVAEFLEFQASVRIKEKEKRPTSIARAVKRCALEEVYNRPIGELSKGFKQRVGLAQAILHDPEILILDEPTTGLDPNQIQEIRNLIRDLGKEKTIILSTHIMQEVEAVCDRILIVHRGKIAAEGSSESIARELRGEDRFFIRFIDENAIVAGELAKIHSTAAEKLAVEKYIGSVDLKDDGIELVLSGEAPAGFLFKWAVSNGFVIAELSQRRLSLEDIFAALTTTSEENS